MSAAVANVKAAPQAKMVSLSAGPAGDGLWA
jgi:hypothetical protein